MEESSQVITHLRAEVTSLRQCVTSLTVQVQTQEAVLNALQNSLRVRETEMANQCTTMAELQSALEEHAVLASELQQPSPDSPKVTAQALTEIKTNLARVDDLLQEYLSLVCVAVIERTPHNLWQAVQTWVGKWQTLATTYGVTLQLDGVECLGCGAFHESN